MKLPVEVTVFSIVMTVGRLRTVVVVTSTVVKLTDCPSGVVSSVTVNGFTDMMVVSKSVVVTASVVTNVEGPE
jgi:hypothetical protein